MEEKFNQLNALYEIHLKGTQDLQMKINIFQRWVQHLTDQSFLLIKKLEKKDQHTQNISKCSNKLVVKEEQLSTNSKAMCEDCDSVQEIHSAIGEIIDSYTCRIEEVQNWLKEQTLNKPPDIPNEKRFAQRTNTDDNLQNTSDHIDCQLPLLEKEITLMNKKLKETETTMKNLRNDLIVSDNNARDMRAALTAEVAEKHDQVVSLRREVAQLEEQLRQADMQTHFKDDIIKGLRKEVKVARSKETLVEVLGIKERSLCHQGLLEQKEGTIEELRAQLRQCQEAGSRILHQLDWCAENISQQCAQANVPEEFKKFILTMMDELRESVECYNLEPPCPTESTKVR